MKKFMLIALSTGHVYEVPTQPIAENRAAHYHEQYKDSEFPTLESAMEDTIGLFGDDNYQIEDWMKNNMDVKKLLDEHGRLARYTQPDIVELVMNGSDLTFTDLPLMIPQLDEKTILETPLSMTVAAMAAQGNICQMTLLNDEAGKPFAAVMVIGGGEQVVNTFSGALMHLANSLTTAPAGTVSQ